MRVTDFFSLKMTLGGRFFADLLLIQPVFARGNVNRERN